MRRVKPLIGDLGTKGSQRSLPTTPNIGLLSPASSACSVSQVAGYLGFLH